MNRNKTRDILAEIYTRKIFFQMDSQVPGSTFQILFHSISPPKTVAASNGRFFSFLEIFEFSETFEVFRNFVLIYFEKATQNHLFTRSRMTETLNDMWCHSSSHVVVLYC